MNQYSIIDVPTLLKNDLHIIDQNGSDSEIRLQKIGSTRTGTIQFDGTNINVNLDIYIKGVKVL